MYARVIACSTAFLAFPAIAQPIPDALPLGLENLHWTMSAREVASQLLPLVSNSIARADGQITNQASNTVGPYHWHGCVFNLKAYYSKDQLSWMFLETRQISPQCKSAILNDLNSRYGSGTEIDQTDIARKKVGEIISWTYSGTRASYNGRFDEPSLVEISLSQKGGPPLVVFDGP